jgi:flagellin-like protein
MCGEAEYNILSFFNSQFSVLTTVILLAITVSLILEPIVKLLQINMATFNGSCHCGQTNWTVKLEKEQQAHVLWCHLLHQM